MTAPIDAAPEAAPAGSGVSGILGRLGAAFGAQPGVVGDPTPIPAPVDPMLSVVDGQVTKLDPVTGQEVVEPEPETVPEGETPPELTPEEIEAAEAERKERTVELPEWSISEPALEIEVEDPAVAQRLRAMVNARERKAESEERMHRARQQMAEVNAHRASVRVDPIGYVTKTLDPERQAHLAFSILLDPQNFDQLRPVMEDILGRPEALAVARANLRASQADLAAKAKEEARYERAVETNIRDIEAVVQAFVPTSFTVAQRKAFLGDAFRDLEDVVNRTGKRIIDPRDIPLLLAPRLRASGMDAAAAQQAIDEIFSPRRPKDPAGSPSVPPQAGVPAQKVVAAAKARAIASSSAPAGAGAPTATIPPAPPGSGIKGRLAHYAKVKGLAR